MSRDIEFMETMDPHSLAACRGDEIVASLQWHPQRAPRIVLWREREFTSAELRAIADKFDEESRKR